MIQGREGEKERERERNRKRLSTAKDIAGYGQGLGIYMIGYMQKMVMQCKEVLQRSGRQQ